MDDIVVPPPNVPVRQPDPILSALDSMAGNVSNHDARRSACRAILEQIVEGDEAQTQKYVEWLASKGEGPDWLK